MSDREIDLLQDEIDRLREQVSDLEYDVNIMKRQHEALSDFVHNRTSDDD